jgi:hypothetical protein
MTTMHADPGGESRGEVDRHFACRPWRASLSLVAAMFVAVAGPASEAWGESCGTICKGVAKSLRRECTRDCKAFKKAPFCRGQRGAAKRECKALAGTCVRDCAREWPDETAEGRANRKHCQFICKECLTRDQNRGRCIEGTGPERFIRCCSGPGEPACCFGTCCAGTCCTDFDSGSGQCCAEGGTCENGQCVATTTTTLPCPAPVWSAAGAPFASVECPPPPPSCEHPWSLVYTQNVTIDGQPDYVDEATYSAVESCAGSECGIWHTAVSGRRTNTLTGEVEPFAYGIDAFVLPTSPTSFWLDHCSPDGTFHPGGGAGIDYVPPTQYQHACGGLSCTCLHNPAFVACCPCDGVICQGWRLDDDGICD